LANLTEQQLFDAAVYELATTDPVMGGPGGVDNRPHQQLANRTAWLKQQVDALLASGGGAAAITAAINTHLAATDPHAQYTTAAEVNALIAQNTPVSSGLTAASVNAQIDARALLRVNMPQGLHRVATNLPVDYKLQTWSDALEDGHYDVQILTPQGGLPAGWWYIDVQRHAGDGVANQYRTITATSFGSGNTPNDVYQSTDHQGIWTPFERMTKDVDFTSSLTANGYQKLPNGLIIQWGSYLDSITFPIVFPNAVFSLSTDATSINGYQGASNFVLGINGAVATTPNRSGTYMAIGH